MCVVSAVGDDWSRPQRWPNWPGQVPFPNRLPSDPIPNVLDRVTRQEFDELKALVMKMKEELEAARAEDIADGNPDCEMEDKVIILKKIAEAFGFDLSGVFPNGKKSK